MDAPKISVCTPMYNRKNYIAQCIDSVLNQTFQDFELIVRDDGSTDGSADFVEERYAEQIASGKIKLRRNERNIGEFPTYRRLIPETQGKYLMFLSSDDLYMPDALEHLYNVAEEYNADVVHSSTYYRTLHDGTLDNPSSLIFCNYDKRPVTEVSVMSDNPVQRFNDWRGNSGIDSQFNIFNRNFFIENDLTPNVFGKGLSDNRLNCLKWTMRAKVFVKTPNPFYVYRVTPGAQSRTKCPPERVANYIATWVEMSRHLDKYFAEEDFFRDNKERQYLVRSRLLYTLDNYFVIRQGSYKGGVTMELNDAVEDAFREYFGEDAPYVAFLFHWVHCIRAEVSLVSIAHPPKVAKK